jgi:hypothetical protein
MKIITYAKSNRMGEAQYNLLNKEIEKWESFRVPKSAPRTVQLRCDSAITLLKASAELKYGDVPDKWSREHLCYKTLKLYMSNRGIEGAIYYDITDNKLEIQNMMVAPWNQGKFSTRIDGVGSKMLNDVFKIALSRGVTSVELTSIPESYSFYKKAGFVLGKNNEDGRVMRMNAHVMKKYLNHYFENNHSKSLKIIRKNVNMKRKVQERIISK